LIERLGWIPALVLSLAVMAAIYWVTVNAERRRHGGLEPGAPTSRRGLQRFVKGPWPLLWGAVALALGNFATLYLAGRPWGVTSALALWGSKMAGVAGVDVTNWTYWQGARAALASTERFLRRYLGNGLANGRHQMVKDASAGSWSFAAATLARDTLGS